MAKFSSTMLRGLTTTLLLTVAAASFNAPSPTLKATYTTECPGVDGFFEMPRTMKEASSSGWSQPPEWKSNSKLKTFCYKGDPRICLQYDAKGTIAGYLANVLADRTKALKIPGFDYTAQGYKEITLFGTKLLSFQFFFVSKELIESGGRQYNNNTQTLLELRTPFSGGKSFISIPDKEDGIEQLGFTKKSCCWAMGTHYFWGLNKDQKPEEYNPVFVEYDAYTHDLVGFGMYGYGTVAQGLAGPQPRRWFSNSTIPLDCHPRLTDLEVPQWWKDYSKQYGIYEHHIYPGEKPWNIIC